MSLYLVTGGAGFIGSHIVDELLRQNKPVRVLDNFSTGKKDNLVYAEKLSKENNVPLEIVEGDIRDENIVMKVLKDVDIVFHQAALRSVPRSVEDPLSTNDVNIGGTLLLLKLSKEQGIKKFIYASSSSVYGNNPILPKHEKQLPEPISPYAVSKLTGEYYCQVYASLYGLETVSLRYFNVFGPRQDPESQYAAVIPKFIMSALKNESLEIHGDGLQSRDFSYIDNIVLSNMLSIEAKNISGKIFNIGCGKNYTVLQVAKTIGKILHMDIKYKHTSPRPGDVKHTLADISSAKKYIKYRVIVDFEEGLHRTINFFKQNKV